jgi:hypothetical protein
MRHARSDYDFVQDLAKVPGLADAYIEAQRLLSDPTWKQQYDAPTVGEAKRCLQKLVDLLYPLIDGGPTMMRSIIPDDEPVFLLRAKDQIAPSIVRAYAKMHHGDERFVRACVAQADRMEDYAREHYAGGKEADAPAEALRI